jgi:hypothetical protein
MALVARDIGAERPLDALTAAQPRAWVIALRETLSPTSAAGYVHSRKVSLAA